MRNLDEFPHKTYEAIFALLILSGNLRTGYYRLPAHREQGRGMCVQSQIDPWLRRMALFAYIDDSGSEPSQPVYVLGGLVLPEETWPLFEDDWLNVLHSDPYVEYFKGSEVWDREKGPFRDLTTQQRSDKVSALVEIIETYKPLTLCTRLKWSLFEKFRSSVHLEPEFDDPYIFLFFSLIAQAVHLGAREPKFAEMNFVFDEQGEVGKWASLWYMVLLHRASGRLLEILGKRWPDFKDEKKSSRFSPPIWSLGIRDEAP